MDVGGMPAQLNELSSNAKKALAKARLALLANFGTKDSSNLLLGKNGEIVYSKNNVCVHEGGVNDADENISHIPGYLTIRCQNDELDGQLGTTLILQWMPNSTLEKNPSSIRCVSPTCTREETGEKAISREITKRYRPQTLPDQVSYGLLIPSINLIPHTPVEPSSDDEEGNTVSRGEETKDKSGEESSEATSGDDESCTDDSCSEFPGSAPQFIEKYLKRSAASPEQFAEMQNLTMGEAAGTKTPGKGQSPTGQRNSLFSVNLGKMRTVRTFYSDPDLTSGQLVIANQDSQYKLLHFHNGGLDKLVNLLETWRITMTKAGQKDKLCHDKRLFIALAQPKVGGDELDPEEGLYDRVSTELWKSFLGTNGHIADEFALRKTIFYAMMEPDLRKEIWPYLLGVYSWATTYEEKEVARNDLFVRYQRITKKRLRLYSQATNDVLTAIESSIVKDVVRTDRKNPFFAGDDNPNLETMRRILLNYAITHPQVGGYIQGMSDLLGPLLSNIHDESLTYWCFVGLMEQSPFKPVPAEVKSTMEQHLEYLRELLRLLTPGFYSYLQQLGGDALQMLFVHRWILLCLKREFSEAYSMHIWEACWSHYRTRYFHLFVCAAIVAIYGHEIVSVQKLPHDELLLYFSALSQHMCAELVIKKLINLPPRLEAYSINFGDFPGSPARLQRYVTKARHLTNGHLTQSTIALLNAAVRAHVAVDAAVGRVKEMTE